jgi:hypothetical protein
LVGDMWLVVGGWHIRGGSSIYGHPCGIPYTISYSLLYIRTSIGNPTDRGLFPPLTTHTVLLIGYGSCLALPSYESILNRTWFLIDSSLWICLHTVTMWNEPKILEWWRHELELDWKALEVTKASNWMNWIRIESGKSLTIMLGHQKVSGHNVGALESPWHWAGA